MRKTKAHLTNVSAGAFLGVLLFFGLGWSQISVYPETLWIHVTFYDFHSDRSNPEFEQRHTGMVRKGMVGSTLDAERKPVLGPVPYMNYGIAKWFRPYVQGAAGNYLIPSYTAGAGGGEYGATVTYNGMVTVAYDTAFKNIVIQDSLPFIHQANGVYQYSNQNFFMLDNRGFGNEAFNHNFSFTMELHDTFTYQTGLTFQFEGDDDVWAFINNNLEMDLGGIHSRAAASFNVDTVPGLVVGKKYNFDLFYAERHSTASDIRITTNILSPQPESLSLVAVPPRDTIPAGDSIVYFARIYDDTGGRRPEFDSLVTWTLRPSFNNTSTLARTQGGTNTFFARQAYAKDTITARFVDALNPNRTLFASLVVYVKPGPDYHVWIEPDANIDPNGTTVQMLTRLRVPDTVTLVQMASSETQKSVVGVVRDFFGNFTRLAGNAQWTEVPITTSIINPANGTPAYIGLINRINASDSGITNVKVSAKDLVSGLDLVPDQAQVRLLLGYITKLKFVNAVTHQDITSININTDQDIQILVMGVLSTDVTQNNWIDVTGMWSLVQDVFVSDFLLPTTAAGQWHFSPSKPGGPSNLTVTTGGGSAPVATATIPVTVTPAPPDTVFFKIITPPDSIVAGVPFKAVVSIFNNDGLVPGQYCYPATSGSSAIYQDTLGKGTTPDPTVTTTGGSGPINQRPDQTSQVAQCFNNGLDTIDLTLYRAPYHNITDLVDTTHQLFVILGPHGATTGPFTLNPGPLYRLQLENVAGVHLTGIDTLAYPSGAITVYSVGYDLYGNKRGREVSNWSVDGTLHQPSQTIGVSQVYYDASQVTGDESGLMIARALRSAALNDSTGDSLGFFIKGPPSVLDSAVTRDLNGNGYLDEIELYFSKPVTFPPGFSLTNFTILYTGTVNNQVRTVPFTVSSVEYMDATGTKVLLHLAENTTSMPGSPQTAWRPYVSITGMENPSSVPATQCRDGAGPVIWSVVKTIVNVSDRKQDVVRVTFSEPIQGPNGSQFTPANEKPSLVLVDYRKNANGTWDTINIFSPGPSASGIGTDSIAAFSRVVNDSTLEFVMSNGKDLTTSDYINIKTSAGQIYDSRSRTTGGAGVPPVEDNQKVQVKVNNAKPIRIIPVPNPSGPIFTRPGQQAGNFSFVNNPLARDWVRIDRAGTVITFDLSPPKVLGDSIAALCKIFDVVGNVVTQADTVIRYNPAQDTATTMQYNAYWNGSNSRKMKVAPGLYSTLVYLTYYTATKPKQLVKMWGTIGIAY